MAKTFHLTIAKVGENLFDGEAVRDASREEGVFTVMANHEAFVTPLSYCSACKAAFFLTRMLRCSAH
jgi:F0F1-type ATP synthase epsilon subunit